MDVPSHCDLTGIKHWTYDDLTENLPTNKENLITWLMDEKLMASSRKWSKCSNNMKLVQCVDKSDSFRWECRKQKTWRSNRHFHSISICEGSWFAESNMTLEEIMKFTYWWTQGLTQKQIKIQLRIGDHTAVDWASFSRETCEVTTTQKSEKLGGPTKIVQIDESKIGHRKYHKGHMLKDSGFLEVSKNIQTNPLYLQLQIGRKKHFFL